MERRKPRALGDVVREFLEVSGLSRRAELAPVETAWRKVAGPEVSARTRLMGITRYVVTIEVGSPALLAELSGFRRRDLVARMAAELPNQLVKDIKFVQGSL